MSEFQYYDFYAVDRPLSREAIEEIRTYSSRVNPSSRRATFEYSYSSFRYDEKKVLTEFFDLMLYVANWGSHRLLMKFPVELVPAKAIKEFGLLVEDDYQQEIEIYQTGSVTLLDLNHSTEGGDWVEAEGLLDEMLPLRDQIIQGDYRVLYLAWLHLTSLDEEINPDTLEPEVPPNLANLDPALKSFVEFWGIDKDLIQAAAEASDTTTEGVNEDLSTYLPQLSEAEKNEFLTLLLTDKSKASFLLHKRLKEMAQPPVSASTKARRSLSEIQTAVARQHQLRLKKEQLASQQAHRKRMEKIQSQEQEMWREVANSAALKTSKGYEQAAKLLRELRDYAKFSDSLPAFEQKFASIWEIYQKSVAFRRRVEAVGIIVRG